MKSIITMSVIGLAAAFVLTGCGPKEEGNVAGASATNANIAGVVTNASANTNMPSMTNVPPSTNMPAMTNMPATNN